MVQMRPTTTPQDAGGERFFSPDVPTCPSFLSRTCRFYNQVPGGSFLVQRLRRRLPHGTHTGFSFPKGSGVHLGACGLLLLRTPSFWECSSPSLPLDHSGTPTTRFSRSWGERGLCTLQPGLRWCQTWGRPVSGWSPRPHGACRDERQGGARDLSDSLENPDSWGS